MKKHFLFILVLFISSSISFSQSLWKLIPSPLNNEIISSILADKIVDMYVGVQDNDLYWSSDSGSTWSSSNIFNIKSLILNGTHGHIYAGSNSSGFYISTDHGSTWVNKNSGLSNVYINTLVLHPNGVLFAGTYFGGVFRSTNEGELWQEVNDGITYLNIASLIVLSNGSILAGGGDNPLGGNAVFLSTDNGGHWNNVLNSPGISLTKTPSGKIFVLVPDIYGDHIMVSSNNGENWVDPNQGQIIYSGRTLASNSTGDLFVGTCHWGNVDAEGEIYESHDEGIHWQNIEQISGTPGITALMVDSSDYVYIGSTSGLYKSIKPIVTSINYQTGINPMRFNLNQNYPNPFNPTTNISFNLPAKSFVSLKVFDLLGREVKTIVSEELQQGNYTREWNASDIASGIYLYRIQAGSHVETKKCILLK